ncbi:hypothetical protein Tco_0653435 [Tanacetum coccineum]|uniref:Uncharacterized protein n=1 Tax=Tanacetum coccineum TaxID=301880 RepID=A0ABQ4X160_9ASTR
MDYFPKTQWSTQDKRRARVMISSIDRKLRDRRLMRSLEKFIGGRPFYTSVGNPVKEILLKLNLPDHRSILTDSKVTPTTPGRMTKPYLSPRFIANCLNAGYVKMVVKVPNYSDEVLKLKNFKKDATLKLSKSTNQEWYEHVGPEVTRSQDDKVTRWRNEIMLG